MRYTGIQPQYFPRLHYFARILATDIFVIRDDAQFVRKHKYPDGTTGKSYQAHTPVKQSAGLQFIMVPTKHAGFVPLHETDIAYQEDWVDNHLKTLRIAYANAANFDSIYPEVEMLLSNTYKSLAQLNITTTLWGMLKLLGKKKVSVADITIPNVESLLNDSKIFTLRRIKKGSQSQTLKKKNILSANEKIIALMKENGATVDYCGGTGVAAYVDHSLFEKNGISIEVQNWKCKPYTQLHTKQISFIPNLSILDLLFNVSTKEARSIIAG